MVPPEDEAMPLLQEPFDLQQPALSGVGDEMGEVIVEQTSKLIESQGEIHQPLPGVFIRLIDNSENRILEYDRLRAKIVSSLSFKLKNAGVNPALCTRFAEVIFQNHIENNEEVSAYLDGPGADKLLDQVLDQVAEAAREFNRVVKLSFANAALLTKPKVAPARWEDARERELNLGAMDFFLREYGPWLRGNSLYQSDLKRLGQETLFESLKTHQRRKGQKMSDLLPPKRIETDRALDQVEPDSPAAAGLKLVVGARNRAAEHRKKPRPRRDPKIT